MMSLESIDQLSREAGLEAAERNLEPLVAFVDGDIACKDIPNLGDHEPEGWTLLQRYFVDKSGFGAENEPALTVRQFLAKIKGGLGYAIVEEGQFQIYIGEFEQE